MAHIKRRTPADIDLKLFTDWPAQTRALAQPELP
jgi:hypothetical protein